MYNNNGGYRNNNGYRNNGYRNNGYNNNGYNGYDGRREYRNNYNNGGYRNNNGGYRGDRPAAQLKYTTGSIVKIKNSDFTATIVRLGREQYECRLPDMSTQWFYEHELEVISEGEAPSYNDSGEREFKYNQGDVLKYINTGEIVTVVRIGREQYECRLPNMSTSWFYEDELTYPD